MSKISLKSKLSKIIQKEIKQKKICYSDRINKTENWDSISNFNILLKIEEYFSIKFSTNEFNSLNNFKKIYEIVKNKLKKKT
jgi:acyl carrier protein